MISHFDFLARPWGAEMLSHTARSSLRTLSRRSERRVGASLPLAMREYSMETKDSSNPGASNASTSANKRPINSDPKRGGFQATKGGFTAPSNSNNTNFRRSPDLANAAQGYSGRGPRPQQGGFQASGSQQSGDRSTGGQRFGGDRSQGGYVQRNPTGAARTGGQSFRYGSESNNSNAGSNSNTGGSGSSSGQGRQQFSGYQPRRFDNQRSNQQVGGNVQQRGGNQATQPGADSAARPRSQFFDSAPAGIVLDAADAVDAEVDIDLDDGLPDTQGKQRGKTDMKKQILAKHALAKRKRSLGARGGAAAAGAGAAAGVRKGGSAFDDKLDEDADGPIRLPGFASRVLPEKKKADEDDLNLEDVEEEEAKPSKADLFDELKDKALAGDNRRGLLRPGEDDKEMNDFILGGADARELRAMERQALLQEAQLEKLKNPSIDIDEMEAADPDVPIWAHEVDALAGEDETALSTDDSGAAIAADDDAPSVVVSNDNPYTKDWLPDGTEVVLPEDTEPDRPFLDSNQDAFIGTPKQELADMEDFSTMLDEFEQVEDGERKAVGRVIASLDTLADFFDDMLFKYQRRAYQQARSRKRWQKFMKQVREKAEATKKERLDKRLKRKEAEKVLLTQQTQGLRTGDWFYYKALKMWVRKADLENPMIRSTIATIVDNPTYDLPSKQRAVKIVMNMVSYLANPPKEDVEHANWVYSMPKKKAADPRETEHMGRIPDMDWNKLISDAERSISFDDMKEKYTFSQGQSAAKPLIHETFRESSD
eukprot:TRINITY_DN1516_c0_g3_i2.p1 TRINITY_DN1516_c0_g3~~TRINITY_DN1516_c0_g3_i2.p1  ORF type:complete len:768 (-),score=215.89 TRINITY_DN1516_c0_g3_i2:24-2327(-)